MPQAGILEMATTVELMPRTGMGILKGAGLPKMVEKLELLPGTETQGMAKIGGMGADNCGTVKLPKNSRLICARLKQGRFFAKRRNLSNRD